MSTDRCECGRPLTEHGAEVETRYRVVVLCAECADEAMATAPAEWREHIHPF